MTQEIDKEKLHNDLQQFFCIYQQAIEHPALFPEDFANQEDVARKKFMYDPLFHAKVQRLLHIVMDIVEKNL